MTTVETPIQALSPSFAQRLLVWVWNALNAFVGGMAGAGAGVGLGSVVGAANFTQRQFWVMAISAGVVALFSYVRSNRLPDIFLTESTRAAIAAQDSAASWKS